jgi:hypothetical protein
VCPLPDRAREIAIGHWSVQRHSNINRSAGGQTLANLVLTQVGQESGVVFECGGVGRAHIVVDVMGYVPFPDTP